MRPYGYATPFEPDREPYDSHITTGPHAVLSDRIAALDGLRALAVTLVVSYHCAYGYPRGGFIGVDLFFVLSGFLITRLLIREVAGTGTLSFADFYWRRVRRLAPPLAITIVLALLVSLAVPSYERGVAFPLAALAAMAYFGNLLHITGLGLLGHTWSLSIEEQFYLVWPAIVLVLLRGRRSSALKWFVLAATSASVLYAASTSASTFESRYDATLPRVGELLIGALLALAFRSRADASTFRGHFISTPTAIASISTIVVAAALLPRSELMFRGPVILCCIASASIIGHCSERRSWLTKLLSHRLPVRVGQISYGLYLYHFPLTVLFDDGRFGLTGPWQVAARMSSALVLADLSYRVIEAPAQQAQRPFARVKDDPTGKSVSSDANAINDRGPSAI